MFIMRRERKVSVELSFCNVFSSSDKFCLWKEMQIAVILLEEAFAGN